MKITHYSNSFLTVEAGGTKLVCDPWRGIGNHGGWHSFPEFSDDEMRHALGGADVVYISHLHSDHFDPATLKAFAPLDCQFVIYDFPVKPLLGRLRGLGIGDIRELGAFEVLRHGDLTLAIIPQMTSNSAGLDDAVNYDLDSSIVVSDGTTTFFNQVDNPLSHADFRQIRDRVKATFGEIDVATLTCGAASEFPQCFLNLDRSALAADVIDGSLRSLVEKIGILQPKAYFHSGGTYFIPGRHAVLNQYLASPGFDRIRAELARARPEVTVVDLEGGRQLHVDPAGTFQVSNPLGHDHPPIGDAVRTHAGDGYPHDEDKHDVDLSADTIGTAFAQAERGYRTRLDKMGIAPCARMSFHLHDTIQLTERGDLASRPEMTLPMTVPVADETQHLRIHMDKAAFMRCLRGQANWNQTLSGSLCLYEREPNVFHPTDTFSLNFFVLPRA